MATFFNGGTGSPGINLVGNVFDLWDAISTAISAEGWTRSTPLGTYPTILQPPFPVANTTFTLEIDVNGTSRFSYRPTVPEIAATVFLTSTFLGGTSFSGNFTYWVGVTPTAFWFASTSNGIFPVAYAFGRTYGAPNIDAFSGAWFAFEPTLRTRLARNFSGQIWPINNNDVIKQAPFTGGGPNQFDSNKLYILPWYISFTDALYGANQGIYGGFSGTTSGQKVTIENNGTISTYLISGGATNSSVGQVGVLVNQETV